MSGQPPGASDAPSAAAPPLETLKQRRDFLRLARSDRKQARPGVVVQMAQQPGASADAPPRVGFTVSRKVGNAVTRNRARRRLREVARLVLSPRARPGYDYVLIGRAATPTRAFDRLRADLEAALDSLEKGGDTRRRARRPRENRA